jgi:hypothetical protein
MTYLPEISSRALPRFPKQGLAFSEGWQSYDPRAPTAFV